MRFNVIISGQKVSYLKRVKHGAPFVLFTEDRAFPYDEKIAKSWVKTCRQYFENVEMVPAE